MGVINFRNHTLVYNKIYKFESEGKCYFVKIRDGYMLSYKGLTEHFHYIINIRTKKVYLKLGFPSSTIDWKITLATNKEIVWFNDCIITDKFTYPPINHSIIDYIKF